MTPNIQLTPETNSSISVNCHACNEKISIHFNGDIGRTAGLAELKKLGWIYRVFTDSVKIWFCSHPCAFHSKESATLLNRISNYQFTK